MRLTHRHLESIPYLTLFILLLWLILIPLPISYFALLLIPIGMAAVLHQLVGGTLAALTSVVAVAVLNLMQTTPSTPVLASTWPFMLAYIVIGIGLGWLVDREQERERIRIHQLESERSNALSAIHEAGREIAATHDLTRTLRMVMNKAAKTLPMDAGILFLRDEKTQTVQVAVSHNLPPAKVEKISFGFDEGVPGWVMKHKRPLIINDAASDPRVHQHVIEADVKAVLAIPLITREKIVGVLNLFCQEGPGAFDEQALQLAQVFANQTAVFIENARLVDELRNAATTLEARVERRTTQLEAKQKQVIRAEKMAAVGRLAGSVAHEVNNPLQAIALHLQIIAEDGVSKNRQHLSVVQDELDRIAEMVQRLLDFQRPKKGKRQLQSISHLLDEVFALAGKQLQQAEITPLCTTDNQSSHIMAVGDQIKQVFLNLILNAVEAMPNGGQLMIHSEQQDGFVTVTFTDSGCGMSAEVMAHLFEPFFSTKHTGSGLGLAVSHEIVTNHGGSLTAVSPALKNNHGAMFTVALPIVN